MSVERKCNFQIADESGDIIAFETTQFDEEVDWSDENAAVLLTAKRPNATHVNITRADLRELRDFLTEVLLADEETFE